MTENIMQKLLVDVNTKNLVINNKSIANYDETNLTTNIIEKSKLCCIDGLNHTMEYYPENPLCKLMYDEINEDLILTIKVIKVVKYYSENNNTSLICKTKKIHYKREEKKAYAL